MSVVPRLTPNYDMKKVQTSICYLCGKPLVPPTNVDHPIMQQLFAPEIRRKYNISKLLTLDVHKSCNTDYKRDEDYFVRTLMPALAVLRLISALTAQQLQRL